MRTCDVLISGTGIAGLSLAIHLIEQQKDIKIILLSKDDSYVTNTSMAQGGIATVCNQFTDSFEQHIQDTIKAGQGKCNNKIVKMVVNQAPFRLNELISWGALFDIGNDGHFDLALEGGHSQRRVVHHKDKTGKHIQEVLEAKVFKSSNIEVITNAFCVDILTANDSEESEAIGLSYMLKSSSEVKCIYAKVTVLATGGSGQLFEFTSNPESATGDGVAMAYRVGAAIKNMQYIQFHPTALFEKDKSNLFLISEAVRGFGAHLVNSKEERFVFNYDARGELATRDLISMAIFKEINKSSEKFVYLDFRHLDQETFKNQFPTIYERFILSDLHPNRDLIPVVPVAHYQCGGIEVNEHGQASLKNLYAIGECSYTGLHGTNRLASNSLLEALVYAYNASKQIVLDINKIHQKFPIHQNKRVEFYEIIFPKVLNDIMNQVKSIMTFNVLHGSLNEKMQVLTQLMKIYTDLMECVNYYHRCQNCCKLENMLQTAMIIVNQSTYNLSLDIK